ncbi:MAG: hypothetical protein ACKER6_00725 [Candidatus Hodgkinia cicadicola]
MMTSALVIWANAEVDLHTPLLPINTFRAINRKFMISKIVWEVWAWLALSEGEQSAFAVGLLFEEPRLFWSFGGGRPPR